ncbi:MAG: ATP-binding protein, partial [Pelobacteraceae bacterium]
SSNSAAFPAGEYVRFVFEDEGCGIPEDNLKNIFDPYFTTKAGGNGLGLASVQSIIRKHRGHIYVSSIVGKGTTFEILLPGSKEPKQSDMPPQSEAKIESPGAAAGAPLLVMDDEKMIRDLASAILEELGYQVTTCSNGEEAVMLYKAAFEAGVPFLAAIMDLTIPGGMGGREAAAAILEIDPRAKLIVSSGYSNDPIMSDFQRYGFGAAIFKPYGVSEIAEVLNRLIMLG